MKPLKNVAASVRQRLLNRASESGRPFNELVQYYVLERWLYRLGESDHCDQFVLKGALLLRAWDTPVSRPTRDIDLLGRISNDATSVTRAVSDVCAMPGDDGTAFDTSRLTSERITEDADYQGLRVKFKGRVGKILCSRCRLTSGLAT